MLCTGRNTRLTRRIAEEVALQGQAGGRSAARRAPRARTGGEWILLDFLDFVVHVFTPEAREFYRLDVLWKQAPVEDRGVTAGEGPSERPARPVAPEWRQRL